MKWLSYLPAVYLLALSVGSPGLGADKKKGKPLSAAEVFKRSSPAIVVIDCFGDNNAKIGTASGFIVSSDGKIVTNLHVIVACQSIKIKLSNGDIYDAADVVEVDGRKDLALIHIKAVSLPVLTLGDSNDMEIGQVVYSIGNPNGLQNTLQQGLVSAFRQLEGYKLVQVSASINPGNSGGPILDDRAEVVAVAAAKIQGMENLGFAIPVNYAKGFLTSTTSTPFPVFAANIRQLVAKNNAGRGSTGATGGVAPPPPPPKLIAGIAPGLTAPAARLSFSTVDTFAGRPWKFEGDGRPALEVPLGHVHGVAYDRAGNLYASDIASQAIVKVDASGTLHVLAGPDSPPQNRPVNPQQIAVDASGAVYFAEDGQRVRMITPAGEVVTIAGSDKRALTPDGAHATGSPLSGVNGVAVMPDGTVVFSEWDNNRVRRIDTHGILQTVAGDGALRFSGDGGPGAQASFNRPMGLAADAQGNLYVADEFNARVRRVAVDGTVTTVAGGGVTKEPLACPTGVDVNRRGDLFIADPCRRRVYALRNGELSIAGGDGSGRNEPSGQNGPATSASFDAWTVAVNEQDDILVAGADYGLVYRISHDGIFSVVAGTGTWRAPTDGTRAANAVFQYPNHLAIDASGAVYLTDWDALRVYRIDRNGAVTRLAGTGRPAYGGENVNARTAPIYNPDGIRVRPNGSVIFAEDGRSNRIREITPDGKLRTLAGNGRADYSGDGGKAVNASLNNPRGLCMDSAGVIYFADSGNNRVRKILMDGTIQLVAGNGTRGFSGDGGPAERAALDSPFGVTVAPDGTLYLTEIGDRRVRRVSPDGIITTIAGDGANRYAGDGGPAVKASFTFPFDPVVGPDRALYLLDFSSYRIRRIDLAGGSIETVAGTGDREISGDGGPPLRAGLGFIRGLAMDSAGDLFWSDSTGRIRVLRAITTQATATNGPATATNGPGIAAGGVLGGVPSGSGGGAPAGTASLAPGPAIQVSSDRLETFVRGKLGVWSVDDAKAVMGTVREQAQDSQGPVVTFETLNTGFSRVTLHFAAGGKLSAAVFFPGAKVTWSSQLAYMKSKFPGDDFKVEQQGDNTVYTFSRSRTTFAVQPDGSLLSMSIF